jgi:NADH dehydrogenase FAD-containing subunit
VTAFGHVVLVGAGHAHLHVIRHAAELRDAGIDVTVIAPPTFVYSGMAAAIAAGTVPVAAASIDVAALAARHGVGFIPGRVVEVARADQRVRTDGGQWVAYSAVSFNVGSVPTTDGMDVDDALLRVKPLDQLATLPARLDALDRPDVRARAHAGDRPERDGAPRVAIIGAGPSGVELAANVAVRFHRNADVEIFDRAPRPFSWLADGPRRRLHRRLTQRGVRIRSGVTVDRVRADHLDVDGGTIDHDLVLVATGLRATPAVADWGLGDRRGIPTRATLQHVDHDEVFAVGDCAHFTPRPLPNLGVYGVRAAPVLVAGLRAFHTGDRLPSFVPQRRVLQVVDLGAGRALATRGAHWWEGRVPWLLKRGIDRRWLSRYR